LGCCGLIPAVLQYVMFNFGPCPAAAALVVYLSSTLIHLAGTSSVISVKFLTVGSTGCTVYW
jgi:hypothetical protein